MNQKRVFCLRILFLLLLTVLAGLQISYFSAVQKEAAEEALPREASLKETEREEMLKGEASQLPALIQATTLESDYRAMTSLGLACTPLMTQEDLQQAYENILCSCVRVQVEGHHGSGSIYKMLKNEIIIVTNRHVLQYWNEDSYVTFFNGAAAGGTLLGVSENADVGFISIPADHFPYEELLRYRNVRETFKAPEDENTNIYAEVISKGSAFFSVDMASDWRNPVRKDGEILSPLIYLEDFQMEMLYGKGEAIPGMSGSGVFDGYGNYLGMMTGGTLQEEVAAVPAEIIGREYRIISGQ